MRAKERVNENPRSPFEHSMPRDREIRPMEVLSNSGGRPERDSSQRRKFREPLCGPPTMQTNIPMNAITNRISGTSTLSPWGSPPSAADGAQ
jgi:hypothetical protein